MPHQQSKDFIVEFVNSLKKSNPYFNPFLANYYLKDINMHQAKQSRERVKRLIDNPHENERALRELSRHLYNTEPVYKRMVHYLSDILTFDWYPIPINATEEDMANSKFKKDYDRMCEWFDRFDLKKEFAKAMLKICLEDGYFVYLRESKDAIFLQEMPIDWCIIDAYWQYGYLYSFNLAYFQQMGVDIDSFAPEFKRYYKNALDAYRNKQYYPDARIETRNGRWEYWQQISPEKGWVFKFHTHFAGLVPPLLGTFLDLVDLPRLKDLQNAKADLEAYKIIFGEVPKNKDNKSNSKLDNFAIDPNILIEYSNIIKNSLPKNVDFKAVPLENIAVFSFDSSAEIKSNLVLKALENVFTQVGIDKSIFNADDPNVSTINLSKLVDSAFVTRLYKQFEDFCTYHVNKITKKYKFRIVFEGTIFDREERQKHALELAQNGIITPKIAAAEGMSIKELDAGMMLMKWLGFVDKLTPVKTSYTMSKNDVKGGRPKEEIKTEASEITETAGSNLERE